MIDTGSQINVHDYKNKKKQEKEEAKALKEEFKKNADVDCFGNLYIDRKKHQMLIPRKIGQQHHVYNFSELESATRTDRMKTNTTTKKKGDITRSLVGGALTGGAGAIVGAATAKSHGTSNEVLEKAIFVLTFSDGRVYQFEVMAGLLGGDKLINVIESNLNMIVSNNKKQIVEENASNNMHLSYIDELKQLKELVDTGIISEEEFE
ncbi:hypothetical protein R82291_FJPPFKPJ_00289 [Fructobacillus cardui]|uniref:SHOCT domain-containing protein n=1 Tax=Fructobacillus cardui TaxID=2893170 RepID=UPI002DA86B62|nr:hypothetical protein R82291_FJPPFKPJ_00289 [Fructobacillus cardui]